MRRWRSASSMRVLTLRSPCGRPGHRGSTRQAARRLARRAEPPYTRPMEAADPLGHVEFAVIDAVNRGALRSRQTADRVPRVRHEPGVDALVHEALRRCES